MKDILTPDVKRQLARALYRAFDQNVTIAARGHVKATGERFFIVNSAGGNGKQYVVAVADDRLVCSCPAGEHDLICKHRALVHDILIRERRVR